MTLKEYNALKPGDKIILIKENNRVVTIGVIEKDPWFKFQSGSKLGFMIGSFWYPYQWCKVVKQ